MRYAAMLVMAVLGLGCSAAGAEVYKWVDEKGTVNYSNTAPPANSGATMLDPNNPRVTFYKPVHPSEEELARLDEYMRFRRSMLLAEEASRGGGVAVADPYPGWYQQCVFEMWADCDDPRALTTRYGNPLWGYPAVAVRHGVRFHSPMPGHPGSMHSPTGSVGRSHS